MYGLRAHEQPRRRYRTTPRGCRLVPAGECRRRCRMGPGAEPLRAPPGDLCLAGHHHADHQQDLAEVVAVRDVRDLGPLSGATRVTMLSIGATSRWPGSISAQGDPEWQS